MKVYVASSWRNDFQPEVVRRIRDADHEVYDFKNPEPGNHGFSWSQCTDDKPPWSAEDTRSILLAHPTAAAGYALDMGAMEWADAIVMVQPCGRSAALELGWGAGAKKLTIALLQDGQEPELMLKMADYLVTSLDEVLQILSNEQDSAVPFRRSIQRWQRDVHAVAAEKGWWLPGEMTVEGMLAKIALIHTEVSEAAEELRVRDVKEIYHDEHGKPCGFAIEAADAVIRIMDLCEKVGVDLELAMHQKDRYNRKREYRHGGKKA